jgi:hypothetical protein
MSLHIYQNIVEASLSTIGTHRLDDWDLTTEAPRINLFATTPKRPLRRARLLANENRIRISRVKLRERENGFSPPLNSLVYNAWNFQSILPQFLRGVLFIDNMISSPLFEVEVNL